MNNYHHKPTEVCAWQWVHKKLEPPWLLEAPADLPQQRELRFVAHSDRPMIEVFSTNGREIMFPGDWIVWDQSGHPYRLTNKEFVENYEPM